MPIKRPLPIISFQPIANSTQEWVGIAVHFPPSSSSQYAYPVHLFLEYLEEFAGFVRLCDLILYVQCSESELQNEQIWPELRAEHICLWLPPTLARTEANQRHINNRLAQGFGICVAAIDGSSWVPATVAQVCGLHPLDEQLPLSSKWKPMSSHSTVAGVGRTPHGSTWVECVDTVELLQQAQKLGGQLFSGSYALNPIRNERDASTPRTDSGRRTVLLRLLGLVSHDADTRDLENLLKQDTVLSYQLIRLVSTASYAQAGKITNFAQAIALLGRRQLQRWLQLLLYAKQNDDPGINPLLPRAAWRARFMELLCENMGGGRDEQDCAFMIGMFSLLDVLFSIPLTEVLKPLNLAPEVIAALLNRSGPFGRLLTLAEYACHDIPGMTENQLTDSAINTSSYYEAVIGAYRWVNQICQDK